MRGLYLQCRDHEKPLKWNTHPDFQQSGEEEEKKKKIWAEREREGQRFRLVVVLMHKTLDVHPTEQGLSMPERKTERENVRKTEVKNKGKERGEASLRSYPIQLPLWSA